MWARQIWQRWRAGARRVVPRRPSSVVRGFGVRGFRGSGFGVLGSASGFLATTPALFLSQRADRIDAEGALRRDGTGPERDDEKDQRREHIGAWIVGRGV